MLDAQSRSGPTVIGWRRFERTRRRLTIRKIGKGQSLQYFRKKKTNGRHASKNASQLETTIATELAKSFSSGMEKSCSNADALARIFLQPRIDANEHENIRIIAPLIRVHWWVGCRWRIDGVESGTGAYWLRLVV